MLQPTRRIKRDVGQQVDGCFKHIQRPIRAVPVEAVFGLAALHVDTEHFAAAACAAEVRVPGFAVLVHAHEHAIVMRGILIEQLLPHERRDHIPVNVPVGSQVGVEPPHIEIGLRQREGLRLTRLRLFLDDGDDALAVPPQQHGHRFGIGLVVELLHETDGASALSCGMVIPHRPAHGDAVVADQPVIPSGHNEFLTSIQQKRRQINLVGLPFLCGCEIYKFAHARYLLSHGVVVNMVELLVLMVILLVTHGHALLL